MIFMQLSNHLKWDSTKRAASANLIKEHICQISGMNIENPVPICCVRRYCMRPLYFKNEPVIHLQMIKDYLIVFQLYLKNWHLWAHDKSTPSMFTHEATEVKVTCFGKL